MSHDSETETRTLPKPSLDEAIEDDSIPREYFQGLTIARSNSDVIMAIELFGKPTRVLLCSFTTAKTLSVALGKLIADLEEASGREIMTTQDVDKAMKPSDD